MTYTSTKATTDTIKATYSGDATHAPSSGTTTVTVNPAPPAGLVLSPTTQTHTTGQTATVTATVTDQFGNPTPGITVIFSVTGSNRATGSALTNSAGQASFSYVGRLFGPDVVTAFADTNGNGRQDLGEPSGVASAVWTLPASTPLCQVSFATDGGTIIAANGDPANFGGNAHVDAAGTPTGQQQYQDKGPVQPLRVHSINVLAVVCTVDPSTGNGQAIIFGEATINGSGDFRFRIDVTDQEQPTASDSYGILLSNGYNSGQQPLRSGYVEIH